MKQKLLYLVVFAVGASIGSTVTWQYVKKKYEKIAEEEIQSVKDMFSKKENEMNDRLSVANNLLKENLKNKVIVEEDIDSIPDIDEPEEHEDYEQVLKSNKYIKPEDQYSDRPYVITPEEFGELDYNIVSLVYYADDVIADDSDEIIDNINDTIGNDAVNHFGEYDDDAVYIRNDTLKCDYEILRSEREYSDVVDR